MRDWWDEAYLTDVVARGLGSGLGPRLLDALVERLPADSDRLFVEHVAANGRAGAFYEWEGFAVDRVEPSTTGRPELAQVWRVRPVRGRR